MTNNELKAALEMINEIISSKEDYNRTVWKGIAELIKESDFGNNDAKVNIDIKLDKSNINNKETLINFNAVPINILKICIKLFKDHGYLKLISHSKSMIFGQKSMTLQFSTKKD